MSGHGSKAKATERRIGTVDLLDGLIAMVAEKLRSNKVQGSEDSGTIPVSAFCNILHAMQQRSEFSHELRHLDFRVIGDNAVSCALGDYLFLGGAWDAHRVPNPRVRTITMSSTRAQATIRKIESDFGSEAMRTIQQMTDHFLEALSKAPPAEATC